MTKKIRIIIVEDDKEIRELAEGILSAEADMQVVKTFANGDSFLKGWENYECDVVLMDINMPVVDGYAATIWLKANHPTVRVLALSMYEDDKAVLKMIRNGACGYVLKEASPLDLLEAIKTNAPLIKHDLSQRVKLQLRKVPNLAFYIDDSLDYIEKIDNALAGKENPIENRDLLDKRKKF